VSQEKTSSHGGRPAGGGAPPVGPLAEFKKTIASASFDSEPVLALAEKLGESLARSQRAGGRGEREGKDNTRNQVRKFYNMVREAKTNANSELHDATPDKQAERAKAQEERTRIKLRTLQAQVAYAVARGTISPDFKELFDVCVAKLLTPAEGTDIRDGIKHFAVFFESLYAYFYFYTDPSIRR
jgi:CRISPR type III-A-associated protein Csm2